MLRAIYTIVWRQVDSWYPENTAGSTEDLIDHFEDEQEAMDDAVRFVQKKYKWVSHSIPAFLLKMQNLEAVYDGKSLAFSQLHARILEASLT